MKKIVGSGFASNVEKDQDDVFEEVGGQIQLPTERVAYS